jgi:DNA mismatch repair protein MutS2
MGQSDDLLLASRSVLEFNKVLAALSARTLTPLGARLARQLLPSSDPSQIVLLQKQTSEAGALLGAHPLPPLDGVSDLSASLLAVEKGATLDASSLLTILECLRCLNLLHSYLAAHLPPKSVLADFKQRLVPLPKLEEEISSKFDSEGQLLDSASPLLASLRRRILQTQRHLTEHMQHLAQSLHSQGFLQEALPTFRDGRPCIAVRGDKTAQVKGVVHAASASGLTVFVEPLEIVPQANNLRRLESEEEEEVSRILAHLSHLVGQVASSIQENLRLCAQVDLIFAKAGLSADWSCVEPELSLDYKLDLRAARHPLLPPSKVVPIDVELGGEFNALVITGPNTGGKTVALKAIGLLSLMANAGLHIPAGRGSRLPFFKQVFADIGDEQSIEQNLSTFSSHISKIAVILEAADSASLVILDELGAGTDPEEGSALAISILKELQAKGSLVAASTHHSALKTFAYSERGFRNASVEFNPDTLSPTYKLRLGFPGSSQALTIARRLGLSSDVVNRATNFLDVEKVRFEEVLAHVAALERRLESELASLKDEASALAADKEQVDQIRRELEQRRGKALEEGFLEARRVVEEANLEANRILAQIRQQQAEGKNTQQAKEQLASLRQRLARLHQQISPPPSPPAPQPSPLPGESAPVFSLRARKMFTTPRELSLRGLTWQQAQPILEKYLDDASLGAISPLHIIHGRGTGSLRAAVHHHLSSHPLVKSFRLAEPSQGGQGVTIVEL